MTALDAGAATVLLRYPAFCRQGSLTPLGNRGGFSGAALWRINGPAGSLCLRAWPPHETGPRVLFRHRLMRLAREQGLLFIPAVFPTQDHTSAAEHGGRLWELTEWLPGEANFHQSPTVERLQAACIALAQLHTVWRKPISETTGCPIVQRRLTFLEEWQQLRRSGWHPLAVAAAGDSLRPLIERIWPRLTAALADVPKRLQRWHKANLPLQPCLGDPWHDHWLFEGDCLSGLIDYGAIKVDSIAADVGRMLGSLVRDDVASWATGLQVYRLHAPFTAEEEELAHHLDETGIALSLANWLRWLYEEKRPFADPNAVARRLQELLERLEALYY